MFGGGVMRHQTMLLSARQDGAAVVAALLVVSLVVSLVAGLLWQQHLQIRGLEQTRLSSQAQWFLRFATDRVRSGLVSDLRQSNIDHLGEAWSESVNALKLSELLSQSRAGNDMPDSPAGAEAFMSGQTRDAQSRFNLMNLLDESNVGSSSLRNQYFVARAVNDAGVAAYGRLLTNLGLSASLADTTAKYLLSSFAAPASRAGGAAGKPLEDVPDLLRLAGYDAYAIDRLKDFVVILPQRTRINVNTASPEVIAAAISAPWMSLDLAQQVVQKRPFNSVGDIRRLTALAELTDADIDQLSVTSNYFLAYAAVRLGEARRAQLALLERNSSVSKLPTSESVTRILWTHPIIELPGRDTVSMAGR